MGVGSNDLDLEHINCNLCGSTSHTLLFTKRGTLSKADFRIVKCDSCGLAFVNPRLSQAAIVALYQEDYFQGEGFDSSVHYEEIMRSELPSEDAKRAITRISSLYAAPAKILEIGPGMGGLMRLAQKQGYAIQGLELSDYATQQLTALGLDVQQGVLPAQHIADNSMDVVIAIEVIEHVTNPMDFFNDVRRILRPGGMFYYETGNIACEQAVLRGANWNYIMPEGHLYYFSPKIMQNYLEQAGLKPVYPNWSLPSRTVFRVLQNLGLTQESEIFPQGWRGVFSRRIIATWDRFTGANEAFPIGITKENKPS